MMADGRRAGILLHPTSLPGEPGEGGYGELGGEAGRFFTTEGNWSWRINREDTSAELASEICELTRTYGR